jgi:hypothetical protein
MFGKAPLANRMGGLDSFSFVFWFGLGGRIFSPGVLGMRDGMGLGYEGRGKGDLILRVGDM